MVASLGTLRTTALEGRALSMDWWACHSKKSEKLMEDPNAGARSLENTDFGTSLLRKLLQWERKGMAIEGERVPSSGPAYASCLSQICFIP